MQSSTVGYYSPNDLLVGENSAWGIDANLGPVCKGTFTDVEVGCNHRWATNAYHFGSLPGITLSPAETSDPAIIVQVGAVAKALEADPTAAVATLHRSTTSSLRAPFTASAASNNRGSHTGHKKTHAKPSVTVVALTAIGGGLANKPQTIPVSSQGFIVSDHPFLVSCDGASWEAESIAPGVWATFGAAVQCAVVAQLPAGAGYLSAAAAPSIRVTATSIGSSTTIVRVFGARALSATMSRSGKHSISLHRVHGHWQVAVRGHHKEPATITVVSGHQIFRGTFNL